MSWAEVKKLNSDLSTPLNILATIQHIDMVGDKYVGYGDIKGTVSILETDALYNHMIAKTVLGGVVASQNDVALAVIENDSTFKKCLGDNRVWALVSQNSISIAHCETKLSASTGVGEWLAFLADSDNATLQACADMTAVLASETAMAAVLASETAMAAVIASETAMTALVASSTAVDSIINNDVALYYISQITTALSSLASSIENTTTILWESDLKWQTIYDTLNASALFTKSGLLTDTGSPKNRSGNLITLIESARTITDYNMGIAPAHTGCYEHPYAYNWTTQKHIMWGGHTSTHQQHTVANCYVKHYMFTPVV